MGINETVKSFLLQKHHEFASKTRLGRAAQRVWVKHQLQEKGILNPTNYNQPQMNTFYDAIVANYIYLHETHPQTFLTDKVLDRDLLKLEAGKEITHADLYLHRVIEKARTVEFEKIAQPGVDGLAFNTGIIVDNNKTANIAKPTAVFFKSGQYLSDPNCPKAFANIVQSSTIGLNGLLGHICSSKETREAFLTDPKGFIDSRITAASIQLSPEQQQSVFAMTSPAFVEAIRSNEKYLSSTEARISAQSLKETTSHEAFHLGMLPAEKAGQEESLEQSYAKTAAKAAKVHSISKEKEEMSNLPENVRIGIEANDRALEEIYTDIIASRACNAPIILNSSTSQNGNVFYSCNTTSNSGYVVNEPIFTLLENMINFSDHSTLAIHDYFANTYVGGNYLPNHVLFSDKSAFNIVDRDGKINIPSQFIDTIREPGLYGKIDPFHTFCALTNNILSAKQIATENKTTVDIMPMAQQVQNMLLQSFQQTEISHVASNVINFFKNDHSLKDVIHFSEFLAEKEAAVEQMFTSLIFSRDANQDITACKEFITATYGKDATLASVLQSPKSVEEIQALIDNGIIMQTENLTTYMDTLSSMRDIMQVVETSIITANPNLTDEQWATLVETITTNDYQQILEITQSVTQSPEDNILVEEDIVEASTISIDTSALHTPLSEDITATVETEMLSSSTSTESVTSEMTASVADTAVVDMGGDCPSE